MNKTNYLIICLSVLLIVTGFLLMTGSSTEVEFNPDVFSTRRITVAPIVCMLGYVLVIVGIMWKPKKN
ncbi:MAG: DUF3098 domain-containing protein [Prevotellaceae bacterium]|jgi:uncharacterized membrane protein|nr:DUF3098 domain-containing protein [Prevotellaceae bacterium]